MLNAPIGGFTRKIIITPISKIPKNGYNSTGFVPSNDFGSFSSNFFNSNIRYPATNPAISAPKNPDETHCSSGRKMEVPAFARSPPTIPGMSAGLSPIAMAMYPARIGNIIPNAVFPTLLKNAANGVPLPKLEVPAFAPSTRKDNAIKIPPPMTNGSMWDTPFIRLL